PYEYNPAEDNVVRTYARQLRKRLDSYFAAEGKDEAIVIDIPRGKYIPRFVPREMEFALPSESSPPIENSLPERRRYRLLAIAAGIAVLAFTAGLSAGFFIPRMHLAQSKYDRFWRVLFQPDVTTVFVPGDSGLVMYQNLTRQNVHLSDYISGEYRNRTASL